MNSKTINLKPLSQEMSGVPSSRTLTAGAGLTGGGDLSADRTFDVGANADGSIVVNADDIQVGVLATDAQHGNRGNGSLHTTFTAALDGFAPASGGGVTNFLRADGTWAVPGGGGDVVGPAGATDNAVARYDGATGKLIQDSLVLISDTGDISLPGTVDGRDVSADGATLDSHIADATIHFTEASIDHLNIQNIGVNSHAAIDSHIADATIHFTEASIDHTAILNVGVNTHAQIDTHIADATIHFTEASIDHTAIQNIGTNSHAAIDAHIADGTIHFTEASIDHTAIQNVGVNTHAQIDTHIADGTIHFTEASIDHTAIQNVGVNTHAQIDSHIADATIHFTEASIDHVNIQNVGTNTHAQIDTHIADTSIHFADAPADGNTYGRNNNAWVQVTGGGASVSAVWTYDDTTTAADPGAGQFRLNNTTIASATALYISDETENGVDFSTILGVLNIGDEIYLQNLEDSTEAALVTITSITDNGTWYNYGITVNDTGTAATWTDGKEFGFLFLINSGGGGGAPTNAEYLVLSADATLTDERVFIDGAGLTATDGGAGGNYTLDVGAGTGIVVNANDVQLDLASNRNVDHSAVVLTAGAGLTGGGDITASRTFDVGAGNGITVNADDIEVDTTFLDGLYVTLGAPAQTITTQKTFTQPIVVDQINERTGGAGVTLQANPGTVDGQIIWTGNELQMFPSDITFGQGYLIGWGATGDPTTPFANRINLNSASGFNFLMSNANFPQFIVGSTDPTSAVFIDGNGNKDIRFNTLDTGFDQDNVVYFGYGGINLQDAAGDAIFIRSPFTVAGTFTITLPPTDGATGQVLVNQDGAGTLDWGDQVPTTRNLTAGAGLTGGGDLTADRTFDVGANADGSIVVNADDIQVGVLATDAQHGNRGGGALHSVFGAATAGFVPASGGGVVNFLRADGTFANPNIAVPGSFTHSGSTNITTTVATVAYDTEELDPDGNYAIAAGELTVTNGGYFDISFSIPTTVDSGGGAPRGKITAFVERDQGTGTFIAIPQSFAGVYTREATPGSGLSAAFIALLADGEVIRVRISINSTTDVSTTTGEASLSLHRVRLT